MGDLQELINSFSFTEILTVLILTAAAIEGLISFYEKVRGREQMRFKKRHDKITQEEEIQKRLASGEQVMQDLREDFRKLAEQVASNTQDLCNKIEETDKANQERFKQMADSDKDSIKAYLTEKHKHFMKKGWIDIYSLECCEKRYAHYHDYGGNSFIEDFMKDLRDLPNTSPADLTSEKN